MGSSPTPVVLLTFLYKVLFPLFWTSAHGIYYHHECYWVHKLQAGWPSGLRRWFMAAFSLMEWVWVPLLSFCLHSYIKVFFHVFWTPAHGIFYHHPCYWPKYIQAGWKSGLMCWFKAQFISMELVRVPLLSIYLHSYTKYCFVYFEHLHIVTSSIINAIDQTTYRQDVRVV